MPDKFRRPYDLAPHDEFDRGSIVALLKGEADQRQQLRAVDWLLYKACGLRDNQYVPDSDRDTAFALGKRFVGLELVRVSKAEAKQERTDERARPGRRR